MDCLACDLTSGARELPGGRIFETDHWVVEHCVGPLGVGTLIVKPFRHCTAVADLCAEESLELGPLLSLAARCVRDLNDADQVYVCLWSHAGWTPGHIHFVIQPAWDSLRSQFDEPGPFLQVAMFEADRDPEFVEVQAFCEASRRCLAGLRSRPVVLPEPESWRRPVKPLRLTAGQRSPIDPRCRSGFPGVGRP